MLARYGVEHYSKTDHHRNLMSERLVSEEQKCQTKQTNQERYGGNAPACSESVKEKIRKTCLDRYGVSSPLVLIDSNVLYKNKNGYFPTQSKLKDILLDLENEDWWKRVFQYK